jgi:hypothetical protein
MKHVRLGMIRSTDATIYSEWNKGWSEGGRIKDGMRQMVSAERCEGGEYEIDGLWKQARQEVRQHWFIV